MRNHKFLGLWKIYVFLLLCISLPILFQNCGGDLKGRDTASLADVVTDPLSIDPDSTGKISVDECDEGWVRVPSSFTVNGKTHNFGLKDDFCVMKFEAHKTAVDGRFVPSGNYTEAGKTPRAPWVDIGMLAAEAECNKVGGRLPTALEARVISQNIMMNVKNWQPKTRGAAPQIGQGCMYGGHVDNYPRHALPAPVGDDSSADPYYGSLAKASDIKNNIPGACPFVTTEYAKGTNTPVGGYKDNGLGSRRTHYLANGEIIWDWSGNVWEWLRDVCLNFHPSGGRFGSNVVFNGTAGNGYGFWDYKAEDHPPSGNPNRPAGLYTEWTRYYLQDYETYMLGPKNPQVPGSQLLNSNNGVGMYWGCNKNSNGIIRGGASYSGKEGGVFTAQLGHFVLHSEPNENHYRPQWEHSRVGFRCVKDMSSKVYKVDKDYKVEAAKIFPNRQSIIPNGVSYTSDFPQTLDLADRARMYIEGMTSSLLPKYGYAPPHPAILYAEPDSAVEACGGNPPCLEYSAHSRSLWGKVALSLVQAREMSGFDLDNQHGTLNIQLQMMRNMLDTKQNDKFLPPVGPTVTSTTTILESLMQLYSQTPNNEPLRDGIEYLVSWHKSRMKRLPDSGRVFYYLTSLLEPHGIVHPSDLTGPQGNVGFYSWDMFIQGKATIAFMDWAQLSGDENTRIYGYQLSDYMLGFGGSKFWDPREFGIDTEAGSFVGHMHSYLQGILGNLARAREMLAVGDNPQQARAIINQSAAAYEFIKKKTGASLIGNFGEIGTVGDMIRTGLALSEFDGYDYYDEVERWTRNQLVEAQIDEDMARHIENHNSNNFSFDHVGHKVQGSFISDATHSVAFPKNKNFRWNVDGCANALRGMYAVWKSIIQVNGKFAKVNLLMNRSHKFMDVKSELPYRGYVQVQLKNIQNQINSVGMRIPNWVNRAGLQVTSNGKPISWYWLGPYVIVENIFNNQRIDLHFPMKERTLSFTTLRSQNNWWYEGLTADPNWVDKVTHQALFRGHTLVKILTPMPAAPPEGQIPRFQRQHLADLPLSPSVKAPIKKERRYFLEIESP